MEGRNKRNHMAIMLGPAVCSEILRGCEQARQLGKKLKGTPPGFVELGTYANAQDLCAGLIGEAANVVSTFAKVISHLNMIRDSVNGSEVMRKPQAGRALEGGNSHNVDIPETVPLSLHLGPSVASVKPPVPEVENIDSMQITTEATKQKASIPETAVSRPFESHPLSPRSATPPRSPTTVSVPKPQALGGNSFISPSPPSTNNSQGTPTIRSASLADLVEVAAGLDHDHKPEAALVCIGNEYFPSRKRKCLTKRTIYQQARNSEPGNENPPDDGYKWRKYGQKDILGSKHPRSYYRCTHHKELGCLAVKYVQRTDGNPGMFEITYTGEHSCHTDAISDGKNASAITAEVG